MSSKEITKGLFLLYLVALFWLIVLKFNVAFLWMGKERGLNILPYSNTALFYQGGMDYIELILNAGVFLPFGMYTGMLFRDWRFSKHLISFFLFSLLCETMQYLLAVGISDITDVINNTLGGGIGLLGITLLHKASKDKLWITRFFNISAASLTIVSAACLIFLRIAELWLFRMHTMTH